MALKYASIWNEIKANSVASVTVSRDLAPTLIQGVKRTKCAENAGRSGLGAGLIPWAPLVIEKELLSERTGMMRVTFRLEYSTTL